MDKHDIKLANLILLHKQKFPDSGIQIPLHEEMKFMMWGLKGFKEQRSNVSFHLSHNFVITMRVHKLHKTLLEAASASIAKSRKKMKISYALSSRPSFLLACRAGVF